MGCAASGVKANDHSSKFPVILGAGPIDAMQGARKTPDLSDKIANGSQRHAQVTELHSQVCTRIHTAGATKLNNIRGHPAYSIDKIPFPSGHPKGMGGVAFAAAYDAVQRERLYELVPECAAIVGNKRVFKLIGRSHEIECEQHKLCVDVVFFKDVRHEVYCQRVEVTIACAAWDSAPMGAAHSTIVGAAKQDAEGGNAIKRKAHAFGPSLEYQDPSYIGSVPIAACCVGVGVAGGCC